MQKGDSEMKKGHTVRKKTVGTVHGFDYGLWPVARFGVFAATRANRKKMW